MPFSTVDWRVFSRCVLVAAGILIAQHAADAQTQPSKTAAEVWPSLRATFGLASKTSVQTTLEKHNGEDRSFAQWQAGAIVSQRVRRIVDKFRSDIDEDNQYNLVIGAGYEFIKTSQSGGSKREHRIVLQATAKISPHRFLLQDRSRSEFRWKDGQYNFRYRNKLTIDHPFEINALRLTLYGSGEAFWDRNRHAWDQTQYTCGVQLPYKKLLMLDTYYMRQNCSSCNPNPVNVLGVTVNLYFNRKKK